MLIATDSVLANRYRIIEKIGSGGMADVYRGTDHVLERDVAVKVLTERSDEVCRRFLLEAQSMARLNHPNIVAVYDVGVDRDMSYIILEFVRGTTMRDIDRSKISFDNAIDITVQLLEALQYAHGQGIIHRDVKPGNIMLTDDRSLKVMDFGLARRMSDVSNLTQSGEIVGTIAYLPPERFLGKSGDRTSDLYSVGVLLYELLCGKLPFSHESDDLVAVMFSHVNDRPKPPRQINPLVPAAMDRIIMRLLEKDPTRRYSDAASLIADLKVVQEALARAAVKPVDTAADAKKEPVEAAAHTPVAAPRPAGQGAQSAAESAKREPPTGGYLKGDLVTSKTFTAAIARAMQGMIAAREQDWRAAEDHYEAAVGMLTPLNHPSELARTYARLGALYCAKIKASATALPSDVTAARQYLNKALPVLREKRMFADVKDAEAHLQALDAR
ncbi:MAG TPA: protein kinase [Candidatus Eremiobacteraceae bacterium]|nr:protein kinase [Candidatus Eremiobacteraceae bacterium]